MIKDTYAVLGGGIIGLATAYQLQNLIPGCKVFVIEKEEKIGLHQSSHNSGVLHCGLYYTPGSLKARLAVEGLKMMTDFCIRHELPFEQCGKVVVASNEYEVEALDKLYERGIANGLEGLCYLTQEELKIREPFVKAKKALLVPQEGIVDYPAVMNQLKNIVEERGGEIYTNTKIDFIRQTDEMILLSNGIEEWKVNKVIACCGLQSDRVFEQFTGQKSPIKIIPFRGEYLSLKKSASHFVNHLIYPVPDAKYPFLGVHFTRMINGEKEVGPNAVLATKREGYTLKEFNAKDVFDAVGYKGLWRFLGKHFLFSIKELYASINKQAFIDKAKQLIPEVGPNDFEKGNAGVRAQAMNAEGELVMDFVIEKVNNQIHVLNAPSPGATASLSIGEYIVRTYIMNEE